jgi:hypothetical protein
MIHIRLRIQHDWRAAVLLVCLLLVLPLGGSVSAKPDLTGLQRPVRSTLAAWTPDETGWHFYLTNTDYAANRVLTACTAGYHMASLWEMLDVSDLIYDYSHPAAYKKADSGYGPPSGWNGWVRTGWDSAGDNVAGTGNCNNWSSTGGTVHGTAVQLSPTWETAPGDISTWNAGSFGCSLTGPVWCVGYFHSVYVPMIVRKHS